MDLSPIKREILNALLLHEKPVKAAKVAKEIGKATPPVQMHLIGLVRQGYAEAPEKGAYVISANGKKAIGLPEVTKETARSILAKTIQEKGFHFYAGMSKPLHFYANDLSEFCDQTGKVNLDSLEFHLKRGDFEAWFSSLGDNELARKMQLLKEKNFSGEELREKIKEIVGNRCSELAAKMRHQVPV